MLTKNKHALFPALSNLKGAELSNPGTPRKACVLGTGNFGTCLAMMF
jgi:hypothetical protein